MNRLLTMAAVLSLTGCLGDDATFEEFCEDRPDVCYGAGKGPYGTTPTGGGIIGGASSGPGVNILRAQLEDNCSTNLDGITREVREQCDGKPTCNANARFIYDNGLDPFPNCSENLVVFYRCGGSSEEHRKETAYPYSGIYIDCS